MKKIFCFFTSLSVLFLMISCHGTKSLTDPAASKLNGIWELNYISGPRIAFDGLFPKTKPTIIFHLPDTLVTGNGGCNGYSCPVRLNGNKISFGDALSTMMYCEPGGEQVYFKTLKSVNSFNVSEDAKTLTLIMGDIAVMRFAKK